MDQIRNLLLTLNARLPPNVVLTPENVFSVISKKLDASVIQEAGGADIVKAQLAIMIKDLNKAAAPAGQKESSSGSSSSGSDDSSSSSGSSSSDDDDDSSSGSGSSSSSSSDGAAKKPAKPAAAAANADGSSSSSSDDDDDEDEEGGDSSEDEEGEFDDDDDSDASSKQDEAAAGQRRERDESDEDPLRDISGKPAAERVELMATFAKKVGIDVRKRGAEESAEQFLAQVLLPAFAKEGVEPNDMSREALKMQKRLKELRELQREVDPNLAGTTRRGRPIYDSNGNFVGVHGGAAATSKSSLCDD